MSFLGPLVTLFWISGDVSSGFQSQSGFCLICYFCRGECNVHSPRFTSGATLADLLAASVQPENNGICAIILNRYSTRSRHVFLSGKGSIFPPQNVSGDPQMPVASPKIQMFFLVLLVIIVNR